MYHRHQPLPSDCEVSKVEKLRIAVRYLIRNDALARGHQSRLAEHFGFSRQRVSQIVGAELARQEKGQVLIIVAMLVIPLAFSMLIVTMSVGVWYADRRAAQGDADSAALGGAFELITAPTDFAAAEEMAKRVALWNNARVDAPSTFTASPNCETAEGMTWAGVPSVSVVINTPTFSLFGVSPEISAGAVACAGVAVIDGGTEVLTPPAPGAVAVVRLVR